MKFILLSNSHQAQLICQLHEQGHVVSLTTSDFDLATTEIFRFRPHAVIICGQAGDPFVKSASEFVEILPDQRFVLHQPSDAPDVLSHQLENLRHLVASSKYKPSESPRLMFFDRGYIGHVDDRKRDQPKPEHAALVVEQNKLLTMLDEAGLRQKEAAAYRNEVTKWSREETNEVGYTLLHRSFKSVPYAQEQAGRWLAIFAHYIPQVACCYLPPPVDPISGVRWVFDGSSPETQYAFACVNQLGLVESLKFPLRSLLDHKFIPGEDTLMAHATLALAGCCALLQELSSVQVSAMDRYLGGDTEKLPAYVQTRSGRRQHQLFCEFWDLGLLCEFPQLLAKTINDFHWGRRSSTKVAAPRFIDILALTQGIQS